MAILVVLYDSSTGGFHTQKIGSAQITDGAIISSKIGALAVDTPHIADEAVTSAKIAANIIATPHIANQGILSASIGAGIIGGVHILDGSIVSGDIAALAIGGGHLANQAVTSAKIAANAIGGVHILDGSILGADLANQAVISAKIAANIIATPHILNQGILSASIAALAVGTPHIAALAIVSGKVASGGLSPLTSGKIWAGFTGNIPREEDKPTGAVTFLALTDTPANFSGAANKVAAVNAAENALEFADPIPKTSDWKGSFNWDTSAYTTNEQDISALFSTNLALTVRRKYSVKLDLTAVEADGSFDELYLAVKEKIDGTNYRAIDRKTITKADIAAIAEPGIPIDIPATAENIQITMQMKTALAGDATIYYAVVREHLE